MSATSPPVTVTIRFVRPDGLVAHLVADPGRNVLVGRDLSCDLRLDGRKVSRRHLRIENRADGPILLFDQGSHNGTYINGQRAAEITRLSAGDLIQAGEWEGRVDLRTAQGPIAARAPGMMPAVGYSGGPPSSLGPDAFSSSVEVTDPAAAQKTGPFHHQTTDATLAPGAPRAPTRAFSAEQLSADSNAPLTTTTTTFHALNW